MSRWGIPTRGGGRVAPGGVSAGDLLCPEPAHLWHSPRCRCIGTPLVSHPTQAEKAVVERGAFCAASAAPGKGQSPPRPGLCLPPAPWPRLARAPAACPWRCSPAPADPPPHWPGLCSAPASTPTWCFVATRRWTNTTSSSRCENMQKATQAGGLWEKHISQGRTNMSAVTEADKDRSSSTAQEPLPVSASSQAKCCLA